MRRERCTFCFEHDPVTDKPIGRRCGRVGTHIIEWVDGRTSIACPAHGLDAIDPDVRVNVKRIVPLPGVS
jgi:hypothetical protein